ncbi:TPA: ParB/RepB/Spo0J family partition protein [Salmonella enterica subsp. enterica serovar Saintpaul]
MTTTKIDSLSKLRNVAEKGTVKRADSYKVRYSELRIKPGHNVRGIYLSQDEYWNSEEVKEYIKALAYSYANNIKVPALSVTVEDGVVWVNNGEHRYRAIALAKELYGKEIEYVDVVEDDDQLTSNSARNHTPIEMAVLYDRYNSEKKLSVQEIAERAGKSVPHVYKYLTAVRKWPEELLAKVQSGELSFTAAQTMYEETRRKKGGDSDESGTDLPNGGEDKSGTDLPDETSKNSPDNTESDADVVPATAPTPKNGGESGTDLPNDGKDKSAVKARKNLTKSISESLVSLIFGAEATETEDGYQLSLTKEQYEAVKALQKQIEDEMTGK